MKLDYTNRLMGLEDHLPSLEILHMKGREIDDRSFPYPYKLSAKLNGRRDEKNGVRCSFIKQRNCDDKE